MFCLDFTDETEIGGFRRTLHSTSFYTEQVKRKWWKSPGVLSVRVLATLTDVKQAPSHWRQVPLLGHPRLALHGEGDSSLSWVIQPGVALGQESDPLE